MPDSRRKGNGDARMKRVFLALLCLLLLLTASGCGSILDGEVTVIEPYASRRSEEPDSSEDTPVLDSNEAFAQAVQYMVAQEKTDAVFRIPLPEDIAAREEELMDVCRSVALETPLGAYAVYYISCRLTPIVAYCNVQVSVTYKREAEDISSLFTVSSLRYMDSRLQSCLTDFNSSLVFRTALDELTADYLADRISYLFRRSPLDAVLEPNLDVVCYPDAVGDRIVELKFLWPYNSTVMDDMRARTIARADDIAGRTGNTDDYGVIQTLITEQNSDATLLPAPSSVISDSVYGFLVTHTGTRRSAALSLKALCDRLNIGCYVVEGWHNGENAWWNIVSCDGKWYHTDPAGVRTAPEDGSLLLSDEAMESDQYFWDAEEYPACPDRYVLPREEGSVPVPRGDDSGPAPDEAEDEAAPSGGTDSSEGEETAVVPDDQTPAGETETGSGNEAGEENESGQIPSDESEQEETP